MNDQEFLRQLSNLILSERKSESLSERNEKLKTVLMLLAKGSILATALIVPGTARLFKEFHTEKSDWKEWKAFNKNYLRQTIRKLESKKLVEVIDKGDYGEVILTTNGKRKILKMGISSIRISKPDHWDGKWRMVFYDVYEGNKVLREKFRHYLKLAGFFPLQKSVYLHAYPCEKEVEFLKHYLGIAGSVRIIIAEKIENDELFRDYFDLSPK